MTTRKSNKESHAQLFNRYIWLIELLYSRQGISFDEICEQWSRSSLNNSRDDFPLRTFHNHRKAIEHMFDINIECDKSAGYLYYIENSDDIARGGIRQWLVNTFAVNKLIKDSHKIKERILFEQIPSGQNYLTQIIEAMRNRITLEISHYNLWRDEESVVLIEPYCVKVFKQRWYVVARCVSNNQIRIYSLDRINKMIKTEKTYNFPVDFDGAEYFRDSYGIIVSDEYKAQEVIVKAFGSKAKYFETLPLHHTQEVIDRGSGYVTYRYLIKPTYDFRQEILSHGYEVKVLAPEWFVSEIKDIVKKQLELYME